VKDELQVCDEVTAALSCSGGGHESNRCAVRWCFQRQQSLRGRGASL